MLRATAHDATVSIDLEGLKDGTKETVNADVVLDSVGRRPFVGDLGLETVNLALDDRGFIPTQNFATSAPGVWAIGDFTAGLILVHKAEDEGVACVEVLSGLPGNVARRGHLLPTEMPEVVAALARDSKPKRKN